ncbi:MAG: ABC transporter six-transmembrane domain-containing protein [Flavobacteriales bacterium]|jgi:ABC-type bacteriocin/lantibiotic exporter with double-glycine peptidase domain|nr:ABC transporter six-transmembrane domain-containing protein [Flavobacteriales bacterium]
MDTKKTFLKHKYRLIFTFLLVLLESAANLLFPLYIGYAIAGAIEKDFHAVYNLGFLGLALIIIGGFRRLIDSRFYAKLHIELSTKLAENETVEDTKKSARLYMLTEIIEFFENQIPTLIQSTIGLFGVAFIIMSLNWNVFVMAVLSGVLVMVLYWLTSKKTIRFNEEYNNEVEKQVAVVHKGEQTELKKHITRLNKINIKLSDLETINFSITWVFMMIFLLFAIVFSVDTEQVEYGALFALIMYAYQYIESVVSLPFFYQQWLRLKEIYRRLNEFDLSQKK